MAIVELRAANCDIEKRVVQIEQQLSVVGAVNNNLITTQDDLQQYGRRTNIRIEGLEYEDGETSDGLKAKIEKKRLREAKKKAREAKKGNES